jgi:hypothetical protein
VPPIGENVGAATVPSANVYVAIAVSLSVQPVRQPLTLMVPELSTVMLAPETISGSDGEGYCPPRLYRSVTPGLMLLIVTVWALV